MDLTLDQKIQLYNSNNDVPLFSLNNQRFIAKIVNIYDGDSFKANIFLNGKIVKFNCRANGYDSPEKRPSRKIEENKRNEIISKALEAREYFEKMVTSTENGFVILECKNFDKYGRLLADVYLDDEKNTFVNKEMIAGGHGYEYHGGTKR